MVVSYRKDFMSENPSYIYKFFYVKLVWYQQTTYTHLQNLVFCYTFVSELLRGNSVKNWWLSLQTGKSNTVKLVVVKPKIRTNEKLSNQLPGPAHLCIFI